jgi:NAD(P)H-hydrate epimerase
MAGIGERFVSGIQQKKSNRVQKFSLKQAAPLLPTRSLRSNKTHGGRALVIAGSKGFSGAAVLAASATARAGAGYTYLATELKNFSSLENPDFLMYALEKQEWKKKKFDSVGVGPGLGMAVRTERIIKYLIKSKIGSVVVDADALTVIARKNIFPLLSSWILTPHSGELARMVGLSAVAIERDRIKAVKIAQKKYGCIVLLKGHETLIATDSEVIKIMAGNPALAKAGTGDVLTGLITGFLAQGLRPVDAARLGAFVHGRAADDWVKSGCDPISLMASDLLQQIPKTLADIRRSKN